MVTHEEEVAQRAIGHVRNARAAVQAHGQIPFAGQRSDHFPQRRARQTVGLAQAGFVQRLARLDFKCEDVAFQRRLKRRLPGFGVFLH